MFHVFQVFCVVSCCFVLFRVVSRYMFNVAHYFSSNAHNKIVNNLFVSADVDDSGPYWPCKSFTRPVGASGTVAFNFTITHPDQKAGPRDTSTAFTYTPGRCVGVRTYPGTWPEHGCLPRQDARARPVGSLSSFLVF